MPYWSSVAPMAFWMLRMPLLGPTSMEVPVSRMAWQPPSQATTTPLTVTLQRETGWPCCASLPGDPGLPCQDPGREDAQLPMPFPGTPSWTPHNFLSSEKRPETVFSHLSG